MKTFKDYIAEESTPLQKAVTAIMAGDYEALDIPYRALSSTIKRKSNHSPKYNLTIYYANT